VVDGFVLSRPGGWRSTIWRHELSQLTPDDQDVFVAALLNPPAPKEAVRAAVMQYRAACRR
jgi:uncharacterized protein (DUF1778 family)